MAPIEKRGGGEENFLGGEEKRKVGKQCRNILAERGREKTR